MNVPDRPQDESLDALHVRQVQLLGQRTAEIVHDFNNLFQGIVGTLNALRAYLEQGRLEEARLLVEDATAATLNAAAASQRLLGFVHRDHAEPGAVDVNAAARGLAPLMRGALGQGIVLNLDLSQDLPAVVCERHALENALLNLVINARDAMAEAGGALTVSTSRDPAGTSDVAGGMVCLCVSDTGPGMTQAVRDRVLEPFFTTKPKGQGTGLGLPMVAAFARQAGGRLDIDSALGKGTSVRIHLPGRPDLTAAADPIPAETATPVASPTAPGATVLVVEDEMVVRALTVAVLRERGYTVLEAADGQEGLAVLMGPEPIDLLISDVGLPGLGGREMAEVARAQRPHLKILFMTGHARDTDSRLLGSGTALITKPFTMEELAARAGAMLGAR